MTTQGFRLEIRKNADMIVQKTNEKCVPGKEEPSIAHWIPTSDRNRLPALGRTVLCCNRQGSVFTSARTRNGIDAADDFGQHFNVIGWAPLPKGCEGYN